MKYIVKMKNPKSGKVETYTTEADSREDLQLGLDFWEGDAGYTIISVEQNHDPEEISEILNKHFPDANPEKIDEITDGILKNSPGISPEHLDSLLTAGRQFIEAVAPVFERIAVIVNQMSAFARKTVSGQNTEGGQPHETNKSGK